MLAVGTVIAKKYELTRLLGSGSMGDVWLAHHISLGEDVALKVLADSAADTAEGPATATARFHFEAQVAAKLSRKTRHIVRVTDHGQEDGRAYLVMELLEGETLQTRLLRGPLHPREISKLIAQVARALTEAHAADVIHRDLKPANVFLARDEEGGLLVKLLDFGIARTMRTHRLRGGFETARGFVFGTPCYMSPEQARPHCPLDHRCDLWALATVAYEALTTNLPVAGAYVDELFDNLCAGRLVPVHERDPALPPGLRSFFERAFAPNVGDRFSDASELARGFDRAVAEGPVASVASVASVAPDLRAPARRATRSLAAPLAVTLLAIAGSGSTWLAWTRARTGPAMMPATADNALHGASEISDEPLTLLPVVALAPITATRAPPPSIQKADDPPAQTHAARPTVAAGTNHLQAADSTPLAPPPLVGGPPNLPGSSKAALAPKPVDKSDVF